MNGHAFLDLALCHWQSLVLKMSRIKRDHVKGRWCNPCFLFRRPLSFFLEIWHSLHFIWVDQYSSIVFSFVISLKKKNRSFQAALSHQLSSIKNFSHCYHQNVRVSWCNFRLRDLQGQFGVNKGSWCKSTKSLFFLLKRHLSLKY